MTQPELQPQQKDNGQNASDNEYDAWNPGIQSQIPADILPLSTIFRPENVFESFDEIKELSQFTGLPREELATFRPERLVEHELLLRLLANYAIPDGRQYEDLGFNFREMASTLLEKHLRPVMPEIISQYETAKTEIYQRVEEALNSTLFAPPPPAKTRQQSWLTKLFKPQAPAPKPELPEVRDARLLEHWKQQACQYDDAFEHVLYQCLYRVCSSIMHVHGRLRGDQSMLVALISKQVCNVHGSCVIGEYIEPLILKGAEQEGYRLLPDQEQPIVMNVKGSSASGKSTLRPLQKQLARKLGLCWNDFALISPDIWRKFLLDYDSLGEAYKYAGACTSLELKFVDQKLDAYMTAKGRRKAMPHLLIDRFRFDSFSEEAPEDEKHLLTRFGAKVFMFYMITPPDATVERAWKRGLKVGRYKAVDDLLDHNVEAYAGMPDMFFTWALNQNKDVHYEFLDNSVEQGQLPRTVAFGENGNLVVLDVEALINIDRYRKINIDAQAAAAVYPESEIMAPEQNTNFIQSLIAQLHHVEFADFHNLGIYARTFEGALQEWDNDLMQNAIDAAATREALLGLFPESVKTATHQISEPTHIDDSSPQTLGAWGRQGNGVKH